MCNANGFIWQRKIEHKRWKVTPSKYLAQAFYDEILKKSILLHEYVLVNSVVSLRWRFVVKRRCDARGGAVATTKYVGHGVTGSAPLQAGRLTLLRTLCSAQAGSQRGI